MKHGHGFFTHRDGSVHEGDYTDDKLNGFGVLTYPNGDRYMSEWVDNELMSYKLLFDASSSESKTYKSG